MTLLEETAPKLEMDSSWRQYRNSQYFSHRSTLADGWVIWDTEFGGFCSLVNQEGVKELLVFESGICVLRWLQMMAARGRDMQGLRKAIYLPPKEVIITNNCVPNS